MKHVFTLLSFALMSSSSAQSVGSFPTDGLALHLPFNGDVTDTGPYALQIDQFGDIEFDEGVDGTAGSCARFGEGDWLEFMSGELTADSQVSVLFWVKADVQAQMRIVTQWFGETQQYSALLGGYSGIGAYFLGEGEQTNMEPNGPNISPSVLEVGNWAHVAIVYDGSLLRMYVDGTEVFEQAIGESFYQGDNPYMIIGQRFDGAEQFHGCLDDLFIYKRALAPDEVIQASGVSHIFGCIDETACNYDAAATLSDDSCVGCELIAGFCGVGTAWDHDLQRCVVTNPSDTDFDGCVGMTDLLDLLSSFGTCVEVPWACGDPLEYQGYDYETVLIGEQCWFAENLRSENYANGDAILGDLNSEEWSETTLGASSVYDNDDSFTSIYGLHYNGYAVFDERGLCPAGWKVSSWEEFYVLADHVGGQEVGCIPLKATSGWTTSPVDLNGTDEYGFAGLPSGYRSASGDYSVVHSGYWSSSVQGTSGVWNWGLGEHEYIYIGYGSMNAGLSVRCLQDAE